MSPNSLPIHVPGWAVDYLIDLCEFVNRGKAPEYVGQSSIKVIGQRCIRETFQGSQSRFQDSKRISGHLFAKKGDVLLNSTGTGTIGRSCVFDEDMPYIADGHVTVVRPNQEKCNSSLLNSLLKTKQYQQFLEVYCYTGSTNQIELSVAAVSKLKLCLPSKKEQDAIATVLDTMDEVIRRTEDVLAKLRQVKAGMLHDLLTHGLDENGALRDPIRHPEQFQDSRLGRIPKEWEVVPLSTCLDLVTSGSREWAQYYATQGALFIRIGNLTREHVNLLLDDVVYVHPPQSTEGARTKVLAGDILVSITADIGIIGCVPEGIGEAFVNQHIALVRAKKEFNSRWIAHYLASPFYQQHFAQFNDGGAKAGMNLTSVGNLPVPIPRRKNEQDEMVESIDQIDLEIKNCGEELRKLAHFKQGLLHDLLTGRVRIPPHLLEAMQ